MNEPTPQPEQMKRELKQAGWLAMRPTIWKAPTGLLYIGPREAWLVMTGARPADCWITHRIVQ